MSSMNTLLFRAAIIFALVLPSLGNAALIEKINNLEIGGILYDVTFQFESFNDLFDKNGNNIFGEGDGADINRAPTFFGSPGDAADAALSILNFLGDDGFTSTSINGPRDGFIVPSASDISLSGFRDLFIGLLDDEVVLDTITLRDFSSSVTPIATFELSSTSPIPVPSTVALAGLALVMITVVGYRQRVS